jgi:5-(carboxyamino)imidazole ribonucleotide synthase
MSDWSRSPVVGIIGGGQLARMLCLAGAPLGITFRVIENQPECPAAGVAGKIFLGDWNQPDILREFGESCDVITLENEFVEAGALRIIEEAGIRIYPTPATMEIVQDKFLQKSELVKHGVKVAPFCAVGDPGEVQRCGMEYGWPIILKTRKLGYDGKGNTTVTGPEDVERAWHDLGGGRHALYCEKFIAFESELATIITTGRSGERAIYPIVETVQKNHICHEVLCPAPFNDAILREASSIATRAVHAVKGIGSFGVEMFLSRSGEIIVNELAPRVHNSGHYSIEACHTSQFENHLRAVLGFKLGNPELKVGAAVMINILAMQNLSNWPVGLSAGFNNYPGKIHWYAKTESRVGRKMGHVTTTGDSIYECLQLAQEIVSSIY